MTASELRKERPPSSSEGGGDTNYADAYAAGYAEGLRESLREMLGHASRGHTVAEFRILIESRIAHIPEDVELKRKSLVSPPRRTAWGPLLRPSGTTSAGPAPAEVGPVFRPGTSYLFREERPAQGVRFLQRVVRDHATVVWVSATDPPELGVPDDRIVAIHPTAQPSADGTEPRVGPNEVAGVVQRATEGAAPIVVYVDTLEFFVTEYGIEQAVRFATWLGNSAREKRSTVVLSVDAGAVEEKDFRRLQRAFNVLV